MSNSSTAGADVIDGKTRRHRFTSTVGAFLLASVMSLSIGMGFLVVPGSAHFAVPTSQFLIWYSIFTLSSAVMFPIVGRLMTRIGVRTVVLASGLLSAVSMIAMAFAPSITVFYILSCPLGLGWAGCTILAANTLVTGWHAQRRGLIVGVVAMGSGFGGFILGFVLPPIMKASGFQGGLLLMGTLVVVLAVLPAALLIRNPPQHTVSTAKEISESRPKISLAVGIIILLLALSSFSFALEQVFAQIQAAVYAASGFEPTLAGVLVSYYAICAMLSKPALGFLHDKFGIKALIVAMAVLFVCGLPGIAMLRGTGIWVFWVLVPIAALSLSVSTVILPLITVRAVGVARFSVAYGVVMTSLWVALAIGAPLWGLVFDRTGSYDAAMIAGGGAGLLGLVFIGLVLRRMKRASNAEGEPLAPAHEAEPLDRIHHPSTAQRLAATDGSALDPTV